MRLTPHSVRTSLYEYLREALPDVVSIYTGMVPSKVPTYKDGTIRPYIGLWVSNSSGEDASAALDSLADTDAVRVRIQTQVVAATEADVYETADLLTAALTNHMVGGHPVLPDYEQHRNSYILRDTSRGDLTPYLPLFWRLETQ